MTEPAEQQAAAEQFEQALNIAEKHLQAALTEQPDNADYIAVAMIEAAVNQAVAVIGPLDVSEMLRDLANQIEQDAEALED